MLAPLTQAGLSCWDETQIQPGQHRQEQITAAFASSRVAVILVSPAFLASEFVLTNELSIMLHAAHREQKVRILWVPLRPCLWQESIFSTYQPVHDSNKPLSMLSDAEADAALVSISQAILIAVATTTEPEPESDVSTNNPYRGLSAFQTEDAHLFYGREALTEKLWQRYWALRGQPHATQLLAVLGPSGSGKSSVALAGLVPTLRARQMPVLAALRIIMLKPGDRPVESLAKALVPLLPPTSSLLPASQQIAIEKLLLDADAPGEGLRRFAADLSTTAIEPLIVVVDQFEEVYTLCNDSTQRNAFVDSLLNAATDSNRQVFIVLTLRSDFFGETQRQHPELNNAIAAQHELVPVMTRDEMRQAIAEPAREAGRPLKGAVVDLLISQAFGSDGALPLLEFALTRIWDGMTVGQDPAETVGEIGGVGGALAGEAERIFESLNLNEQAIARRAFLGLLQLGEGSRDTRRRAMVSDLVGQGETLESVESVLRRFARKEARLVTLSWDPSQCCEVAEVTHEALIEHWNPLRKWIDAERDDIRFQRRLEEQARTWDRLGRPSGALWRSPELNILRQFALRSLSSLTRLQVSFFDAAVELEDQEHAARARHESERRRHEEVLKRELTLRVRILFTATVLSGMLLLTLGWQVHKQRTERQLAERAKSIANGLSAAALATQRDIKALVAGIESVAPFVVAGDRPPVEAEMGLITAALTSGYMLWSPVQHDGPVYAAEFSPNGEQFVTAGEDGTVRMIQSESGQHLFRLAGHQDSVLATTYSPDGRWIATASRDGVARIFESTNGAILLTLRQHEGAIRSLRYSRSGRLLITASDDSTARLWDATDGRLLHTLSGHTDGLVSAVFSVDEQMVATASKDASARIWDVETGQLLRSLNGHKDRLSSIEFAADGQRLLTSSYDGTVRVWDKNSGRELLSLDHKDRWVLGASFSQSGKQVLSWGEDGVHLWSLQERTPPLRDNAADEVVYRYSNAYVATFAALDQLVLIGTRRDVYTYKISDRIAGVRSGGASGSAPEFGANDNDSSVRISTFSGSESDISVVRADLTGANVLAAYKDGTVGVFLIGPASRSYSFNAILPSTERVVSLRFSQDGSKLLLTSRQLSGVTQSSRGPTIVFRVFSDNNRQPHEFWGKQALLSRDGRRILVLDKDGLLIADVESGREQRRLRLSLSTIAHVRSIDWSPDTKLIAIAGEEEGVVIIDVESATRVRLLPTQGAMSPQSPLEALVQSLAFSPDGHLLITGTNKGVVQIWEVQSGRQLGRSLSLLYEVSAVTFSPDGIYFLTASQDRTVRIWSISPSVEEVAKFKSGSSPVIWGRFTADSRRVLINSADEGYLLDIGTKQQVYRLIAQRSMDISPNGKHLAVVGASGSIQLRSLELRALVEDSCRMLRDNTARQQVENWCAQFPWSSSKRTW